MSQFVIEKGIPIPKQIYSRIMPRKYPFDEMEIGDSFLIPLDPMKRKGGRAGMTPNISAAAKRTGFKFTIRTTPDRNSVRIWRSA